MFQETLYHGNLGRAETAPEVETFITGVKLTITGVKLTYTNGGVCKDSDGTFKFFKTSIHFDCVPGKVVSYDVHRNWWNASVRHLH